MLMAEAASRAAARTAGKEAAAVEAFAVALRRLPAAVADNAGYDSADLIARLRASHAQGESTMGLGMYSCGQLWYDNGNDIFFVFFVPKCWLKAGEAFFHSSIYP